MSFNHEDLVKEHVRSNEQLEDNHVSSISTDHEQRDQEGKGASNSNPENHHYEYDEHHFNYNHHNKSGHHRNHTHHFDHRRKHDMKTGPLYDENGTPYDYFVVIDAGSSGSRAYVYNWLNPTSLLEQGHQAQTKFPVISTHRKWHSKIKPGISSFAKKPSKVGKDHLKGLLKFARSVVPASQHSRTPIFLHATAGMRLLSEEEQSAILDKICAYIAKKSTFYIPQCSSHVNILTGDVEGLYGWLAVNSMMGSFDNPELHDHGKNHSTYGLLDMGGASTQLVFQPNATELAEHKEGLYAVKLMHLPNPKEEPEDQHFNVYSSSFLGFGMYEAHNKYLKSLVSKGGVTKVSDPCLPIGYTTFETVDGVDIIFGGSSDFSECMDKIFPVLQNTTYSQECTPDDDDRSSCLLNDLIPAFDFDVNHFIGVSGYWDALTKLLNYETSNIGKSDSYDYKYQLIYNKTSEVCSEEFDLLAELNKDSNVGMSDEDLSRICFQSSWILNFLHLGLGFPRIDREDSSFKNLKLVEELEGSSFTWTLGRAILYANDEYAQAFAKFSKKDIGRANYSHGSVQTYGAEQDGIAVRPVFQVKRSSHRWYGFGIFFVLIVAIGWLMIGRSGRMKLSARISRLRNIFKKDTVKYTSVHELEEFVIDDE